MDKIGLGLDFFRMFFFPVRIKYKSAQDESKDNKNNKSKSESIHENYSSLSIITANMNKTRKAIVPKTNRPRWNFAGGTNWLTSNIIATTLLRSNKVLAIFFRCRLVNFISNILQQINTSVKYFRMKKVASPLFIFLFLLINLSTYQPINCLYAQEMDVKTKIKELKHKDPKVRIYAVKELGKIGKNKELVKAITERLQIEQDVSVRNVIYETLGNIGDKEAVPMLIEKIKTEQNKNIKPMAVLSLGRLQDETAVPVLREIFLNEEESLEVRLQAANALSYIPTEDSVRAIAEGLKSKTPEIRLQAVCSLASFSSDILIKERRELIKKQAEFDPEEKNRNFIKEKILTKPKE